MRWPRTRGALIDRSCSRRRRMSREIQLNRKQWHIAANYGPFIDVHKASVDELLDQLREDTFTTLERLSMKDES